MSMVKAATIAGVLMLLFSMSAAMAQGDGVISTSYTPSSPVAGSTVTFYATINGGNVSNVTLWVEECTKTICHLPKEVAMTSIGDGNYTATYILGDDTAYFHYKVFADVNSENVESNMYNVTVGSSQNGGSSSSNGDLGGTPGFELFIAVVALTTTVFLFRRKT